MLTGGEPPPCVRTMGFPAILGTMTANASPLSHEKTRHRSTVDDRALYGSGAPAPPALAARGFSLGPEAALSLGSFWSPFGARPLAK